MAHAPVMFLLGQISTLIREEYSLLGGIREDVEDINNALDRLTAALRVADEMEEIDPQVQAWVKIIRDLAYDTEDVLDEFLFRFGGCRINGGFYSKIQSIYTSVKNFRARRRIALALQRIKARINENSHYQPSLPTSSMANFHNHNKRPYDSRGDALLLEESDLVGIENPKQFLVNLLLDDVDYDLRVHSIVGMGGLGKTTLVRQIYEGPKVVSHFQYRVWVMVSETFRIEELLKDVISQLVKQTNLALPQDFVVMDSNKLKEFIKNILLGRRYIIVFDDIWNVDVWMTIKYAFPRQSFGSRIVITTRNNDIGQDASHETQGFVYPLMPLSPNDSWVLFCKKTFFDGSCPQHLQNISKIILKRCQGLPLAIVVIAGVLARKREDIEEWKKFQYSINVQLECNNKMKNMKNLISLSYYDLPYYLKYCFLYLSIFPEDVVIQKMRVIQLWIAEGFVKENNQQVKEEVAEAYFNELLHRNLIRIAEITRDGRITGIRIHDILREIILSKSVEQNFAIIANGQNTESSSKFRRLAIHRFDDHILKSASPKKHLRSLQFFTPLSRSTASFSLSKLLTTSYISLKVLDLRGVDLEEIPKEVFNLIQLRYLSLRSTKLRSVPKSIGCLQNLETLDLKHTYVIELPIELLKLCKLRHLLVYRHSNHSWPVNPWIDGTQSFNAPFKIGELLSLQKLCYIQANNTKGSKLVCEIGKLTQLRRLGVRKLRQEDGKEFCSSLEKLTNLCSLSLGSASENEILDIQHPLSCIPLCLRTLQLIGRLKKVPQWLSSLVGLTRLHLAWNRLLEDPLPFLQELPMLAHLDLLKTYEGEELCFKAKMFSKLKCLGITDFEALKCIRIEEGALHHLEDFYMVKCNLLEQVPLGIKHLSNLKIIHIHDVADKLMVTLEPTGEKCGHYAKVSHIPKIYTSKIINGERIYFLNGQEIIC